MGTQARGRAGAVLRYALVAACLAVSTLALVRLGRRANAVDAALTYLLVVLAASTLQDVWLGAFATGLSVFLLNYFFLPPVGTLTIADPANWFALVAFLVTSIVSSQLVARTRRRSREAEQREHLTRSLLELSDAVASSLAQVAAASPTQLVEDLAHACARCLDARALVLEVRRPWQVCAKVGACERVAAEALAADLVVGPGAGERFTEIGAGEATWVAGLGGEGSAVAGTLVAVLATGEDEILGREAVQATARLAAVGLERALLARRAAEGEAARQGESLKTALLSAVSHELRTPLASIRLAATALQRSEVWRDADARAELLDALDLEAARLNASVGNLLAMSRLESGALVLDLGDADAAEIVAGALRHLGPSADAGRIRVRLPDGMAPVRADVSLMSVALANLIDNALKFAPGPTPVEVGCALGRDGMLVFRVADRGPGLTPAERERVFEPFYRTDGISRAGAAGSGLGLSIARALVIAHGGRAWAEGRAGGGSVFCLALPCAGPPTALKAGEAVGEGG